MTFHPERLADARKAIKHKDTTWLTILLGINKNSAPHEKNTQLASAYQAYITSNILILAFEAYIEDIENKSILSPGIDAFKRYLNEAVDIQKNEPQLLNTAGKITQQTVDKLLEDYFSFIEKFLTRTLSEAFKTQNNQALSEQLQVQRRINADKANAVFEHETQLASQNNLLHSPWRTFFDTLPADKSYYPECYFSPDQREQLVAELTETTPLPVQTQNKYCLITEALQQFVTPFKQNISAQQFTSEINKLIAIIKITLSTSGINISNPLSDKIPSVIATLTQICTTVFEYTQSSNLDRNLASLRQLLQVFRDYFNSLKPEESAALILRSTSTAMVSADAPLTYEQSQQTAQRIQADINQAKQKVDPPGFSLQAVISFVYYLFNQEQKIRDRQCVTAAEIVNELFAYTGNKTLCQIAINRLQHAISAAPNGQLMPLFQKLSNGFEPVSSANNLSAAASASTVDLQGIQQRRKQANNLAVVSLNGDAFDTAERGIAAAPMPTERTYLLANKHANAPETKNVGKTFGY